MKIPKVKVQCKLSVINVNDDDDSSSDDVIFVKQCTSYVVMFEVKIGEKADIPICVTGDNAGILPTNPIVIN